MKSTAPGKRSLQPTHLFPHSISLTGRAILVLAIFSLGVPGFSAEPGLSTQEQPREKAQAFASVRAGGTSIPCPGSTYQPLDALVATYLCNGPRRHETEIRLLQELVWNHLRLQEREIRSTCPAGIPRQVLKSLREARSLLNIVSVDLRLRRIRGRSIACPSPRLEQILFSEKENPDLLFRRLLTPELLEDSRDAKEDESLPVFPASLSQYLENTPVADFRKLINHGILSKVDLQELQFLYAARRAFIADHETFEKERLAVMIDEGTLALWLRPGGIDTVRRVLDRISEKCAIATPGIRYSPDGGCLTPFYQGNPSWHKNIQAIFNLGSVKGALHPGVDDKLLASLREDFARLRAAPGWKEIDPAIDACRLFNPTDWARFQKENPDAPWLGYGETGWGDWASAARFVARDADHDPVSVPLLLKLHRIALARYYFQGFEKRRIEHAMEAGLLQTERGNELLRLIAGDGRKLNFSGVNHAELAGKFRWDELERFPHDGEWIDETGRRLMTAYEVSRIRQIPYWKPRKTPMPEIAPGAIFGEFLYPDAKTASREVRRVLNRVRGRLSRSRTDLEVVRIVADMDQRLLAIHPFIDGNGRTIRLLGDLILRRRGLPPPVFLPENELFMTTDQLVVTYVDGMQRWVKWKKAK